MAGLSANIEHATQSGRQDVADRLRKLADLILAALNEAAPPEVQFINELLATDSEAAARAFLRNRAAEVTPEVLEAMQSLSDEMQTNGQTEAAARPAQIRSMAEREAAAARWRA